MKKLLATLSPFFVGFLLSSILSSTAAAQDRTRHPYAMQYGPFITGTWEAKWPRDNFALKGIAIRVGGTTGTSAPAQVIFDTELLRVSAIAMDHYQELRGTAYDGAHGPGLKMVGRQFLATPVAPGWARPSAPAGDRSDGTNQGFADPRPIPHGPLPREWARYKGLYLSGNDVVVSYTVGTCDVLEHFEVRGSGGDRVMVRHLDLGPSKDTMHLMLGNVDRAALPGEAVRRVDSRIAEFHHPVSKDRVAAARATVAWQEFGFGGPAAQDYADTKSGHGVVSRAVAGDGLAMPHQNGGAEGGALPRLHDGAFADRDDDPGHCTWFEGEARLVTDLGAAIDVAQIHTYSRHRGKRAPQVYTVYGSAAESVPDAKVADPTDVGWQKIADVDTRKLGNGGMHGVRISEPKGALGRFRHLLWVCKPAPGRNPQGTFFTEIDIYDAANPARTGAFGGAPWVTAIGLVGAPEGASFEETAEGNVALKLPPRARRAQIGVLFFDGPAASLPAFRQRVDKTPPLRELSSRTRGGKLLWPEPIATKGKLGRAKNGYAVDELTVPSDAAALSHLRFGAFDFFADGRAALSTWNGDVWILSGIDDDLQNLKWKRFATGLFDPLGLKIVDGVIHTLGRDGITKLHDRDGNGEADFYECFNNDVLITKSFHEFAFDLQTDPDGNFYFSKGGPVRPGGRGFDKIVPHHGCVLKVSKDGAKLEVFATGLRAPNGIGVGPDGQVTSGDNEGTWMPVCRLNWMKPGSFNGCVDTAHRVPPPTMYDYPLCFLPMNVDNSGGGQVWVTTDKWGPFAGEMLHLSYGTSTLFKVLREEVDGVTQGGVTPFPLKFTSSCMRARLHPKTGQLFVVGFRGWQTNAAHMTGFNRVRYTGEPVRMLTGLRTAKNGVYLTFTCKLDKATAEDVESYEIEAWNYLWTQRYGSPEVSTKGADPDAKKGAKPVHDEWKVAVARLQPDGQTVFLELPDIAPVMQMRIKFDLDAADGAKVKSVMHSSIHKLPSK